MRASLGGEHLEAWVASQRLERRLLIECVPPALAVPAREALLQRIECCSVLAKHCERDGLRMVYSILTSHCFVLEHLTGEPFRLMSVAESESDLREHGHTDHV